jgi:hypothetical protein
LPSFVEALSDFGKKYFMVSVVLGGLAFLLGPSLFFPSMGKAGYGLSSFLSFLSSFGVLVLWVIYQSS